VGPAADGRGGRPALRLARRPGRDRLGPGAPPGARVRARSSRRGPGERLGEGRRDGGGRCAVPPAARRHGARGKRRHASGRDRGVRRPHGVARGAGGGREGRPGRRPGSDRLLRAADDEGRPGSGLRRERPDADDRGREGGSARRRRRPRPLRRDVTEPLRSHGLDALRGWRAAHPGGGGLERGRGPPREAPRARACDGAACSRLPAAPRRDLGERPGGGEGAGTPRRGRRPRRPPRLLGPRDRGRRRRRRLRHRDRGGAPDRGGSEAAAPDDPRRPLRERGERRGGRARVRGETRGGAAKARGGFRGRQRDGNAARILVERRGNARAGSRRRRRAPSSARRRRASKGRVRRSRRGAHGPGRRPSLRASAGLFHLFRRPPHGRRHVRQDRARLARPVRRGDGRDGLRVGRPAPDPRAAGGAGDGGR